MIVGDEPTRREFCAYAARAFLGVGLAPVVLGPAPLLGASTRDRRP